MGKLTLEISNQIKEELKNIEDKYGVSLICGFFQDMTIDIYNSDVSFANTLGMIKYMEKFFEFHLNKGFAKQFISPKEIRENFAKTMKDIEPEIKKIIEETTPEDPSDYWKKNE